MTTINLQVAASVDDAYEQLDGSPFSSTSVRVTKNSFTSSPLAYIGGERFTSLTIGQGDEINAATMQIKPANSFLDDANIDIHAEDVDDSANYSDTADVVDRTRTTASVAWVADGIGTDFATSPELKTVIQEVIDRAGWVSGNALSLLSVGKSDVIKGLGNTSYDGNSADAAKLDITFAGGAGGGTLASRRLFSGTGR